MSCCSTSLDLGQTFRRADSLKKLSPQAFGHTAKRVTQEAFKNLSRSQLEQRQKQTREMKKITFFFSSPTNPTCLFPSIFRDFFLALQASWWPRRDTLLVTLFLWKIAIVERRRGGLFVPGGSFQEDANVLSIEIAMGQGEKNARGLLQRMFHRVR